MYVLIAPGTGKTFVAKKLAKIIGIDYAMMSGGDVCPLGSDAVTQIHQLFAWAAKSPKGVVLFIDEAECFLGSRGSGLMSDVAHNALNALLYNTGGERKDFMLVLATNRADDLDVAILDRCDESLFFPLPS
jgi:ATPase family AAA domain-containing protein 3A/B